jgi:hypothetical protein
VKLLGYFLLLWLCLPPAGQAQDITSGRPVGTLYLGLAFTQPIGSYKLAYPQGHGLGGTLGILVRPMSGHAPVELGLEAGYLPFGIEKHIIGQNSPDAYTLKTTHSLIPLHAVARLKPKRLATFNPYLDGLAGISIFNTRTKIKQDIISFFQNEDAVVVNKKNSTVFSYGLAAGISFGGGKNKYFFGDLRLVYLESPVASYVKKRDITIDQNGDAFYHLTRSETSMFMLQLNLVGVLRHLDKIY